MWQKGPLPPDTWGWGAVVPKGVTGGYFYFADFKGDHVETVPKRTDAEGAITAEDVEWYDNSITAPPTGDKGRKS